MTFSNLSMLWILAQLSVALFIAIMLAAAVRKSASAAHCILVVGLLMVFAIPPIAFVCAKTNVGLIPIRPETNVAAADDNPKTSEIRYTDSDAGNLQPADPMNSFDESAMSGNHNNDPGSVGGIAEIANHDSKSDETHGSIIYPAPDLTHFDSPNRYSTMQILVFGWILLSMFFALKCCIGLNQSLKLRRRLCFVDDPELRVVLDAVAAKLEIKRHIRLACCSKISCPMIWCWRNPIVILPSNYRQLKDIDWSSVFAHELAHLQRRDQIWSICGQLVQCILPWHPLVVFSRSWLEVLSENACDESAIRNGTDAEAYVRSLLAFKLSTHPGILFSPMASSRHSLVTRIQKILAAKNTNDVRKPTIILLAVLAVFATSICALAVPRKTTPALAEVEATMPVEDPIDAQEKKSPTQLKLNEKQKLLVELLKKNGAQIRSTLR